MTLRAASSILVVTIAGCVTVVRPTTESPAPQPAPVIVQQAPPPPPPPPPAEDPPSRVGRLVLLGGTVSFRASEADAWSPAEWNRPVVSGDRVWTDADGRAEVEVGAVVMRVAGQSALDIVQLDDRAVQVRLPQGMLIERVWDGDIEEAREIDTPNAAVSIDGPGIYRVNVSPDGMNTSVTVLAGQATVNEAGSTFEVNPHQTATVLGPGDAPTFRLADAYPPDGFDRWSSDRDMIMNRAFAGPRYVPVDMPGAADLNAYGHWQMDPFIGPVWYPNAVPADWAPYRTGHWVFMRPWGWTWVDDQPWGYAPYHYGRWAYRNNAWGWCPGQNMGPHPVYAPALVVFEHAATQPMARNIPGQPAVSWVPLAPGEPYQPGYPVSTAYRSRINAGSQTTTVVQYRNHAAPNGLTAIDPKAFVAARPVGINRVLVPVKATGPVGAAPVAAPTRESFAPVALPGRRIVEPPPALIARPVLAMRTPATARADVMVIHPKEKARTIGPTTLPHAGGAPSAQPH
jgi:hypothetical protein